MTVSSHTKTNYVVFHVFSHLSVRDFHSLLRVSKQTQATLASHSEDLYALFLFLGFGERPPSKEEYEKQYLSEIDQSLDQLTQIRIQKQRRFEVTKLLNHLNENEFRTSGMHLFYSNRNDSSHFCINVLAAAPQNSKIIAVHLQVRVHVWFFQTFNLFQTQTGK